MKGFGKHCRAVISSILLVCLLVVTVSAASTERCPGSCAHTAAIGTTHYDTLAEAISTAKAGDTVTLIADVVTNAPVLIEKSLVLDLGSRTLTANLSDADQAALKFLQDGILRNGNVVVSEGSAVMVSDCEVAIEKDALLESTGTAPVVRVTADKEQTATLKVSGQIRSKEASTLIDVFSEEGTCELSILKDAVLTAEENPAITFNSAGKFLVEDGTIQTKKDVISVTLLKDRTTELSITGGKILSEEGQVIVFTHDEDTDVPTDFITGGTFDPVPEDYIPSHSEIIENDDGTTTIISAYILTFRANGGTGTMEPLEIPCGSSVTLPESTITPPSGMDFAGWEIEGTLYVPGDSYLPTADATATALWKTHQHTGGTATCMKKAVCSACGKSYGSLGVHKLFYTDGYAATCTDTGMNAHSKCSTCGGCFVDGVRISESALTIPATGHKWEPAEGKPASCEEDGVKTSRRCTTCNELQIDGKTSAEEDLVIPALGHTLEEIAATQATCKEAGIQAHTHCTTCGGLFLNGQSTDAATLTTALSAHILSDWQQDEYYHWKACVDCGEVFRQNSHMDLDLDGACDDCGREMAVENPEAAPKEESGFSWLFLIPMIVAVVICIGVAIPLAIKKRK